MTCNSVQLIAGFGFVDLVSAGEMPVPPPIPVHLPPKYTVHKLPCFEFHLALFWGQTLNNVLFWFLPAAKPRSWNCPCCCCCSSSSSSSSCCRYFWFRKLCVFQQNCKDKSCRSHQDKQLLCLVELCVTSHFGGKSPKTIWRFWRFSHFWPFWPPKWPQKLKLTSSAHHNLGVLCNFYFITFIEFRGHFLPQNCNLKVWGLPLLPMLLELCQKPLNNPVERLKPRTEPVLVTGWKKRGEVLRIQRVDKVFCTNDYPFFYNK